MNSIVISVKNVSKCYQVFSSQHSRLLHAIWPKHKKGMQEVRALNDINFEIKRGEAVAIIGRNGGGKSTLLEILTGTLTPSTGEVKVNGRVSALLELGSGFNPEYTGRDNVMLNGLLLGLTREEILRRFDEIIAFAEIGDALDRPVKTYSSGMMMRLAFAVQVLCDPDILIIDEALSVGDFFFQQKCLSFIRGLCAKGVTLLFVSHDMGTVRDLCRRSIYLCKGCLLGDGETAKIISSYLADSNVSTSSAVSVTQPKLLGDFSNDLCVDSELFKDALWRNESQSLDSEGKLLAVSICDKNDNICPTYKIGEVALIRIAYLSNLSKKYHAGISILDKFGQVITATGSYFFSNVLPISENSASSFHIVVCELKIRLQLESGQYSFQVSIGTATAPNRGILLGTSPFLGPINITWDYENEIAAFLGKVGLPVECRCYLIDPAIFSG